MRLVLASLILTACTGQGAPRFSPISTDGHDLRDDQGRVVLLRGVNARVEGVFDVTFDDGRVPLEPIPRLAGDDCARMRELGFNLLRLPINWSGIEPVPGAYDEAYLGRVDAAVECAAGAGLLVLIDLHQDAYSKEIGEDGAPLWAIDPAPEETLEGPLEDLDERRVSQQVQAAFETFFDPTDPAGLQASFVSMLERVAARYAENPAVVGFEIFNEPVAGAPELDPFQITAARALREAAPRKLIFFEPPAVRNLLDFQPLAARPFPVEGAVYAPHIYTFVFGDQQALAAATKQDLRVSVQNARDEAYAWGTPLFVGEFGVGPDAPNAGAWMQWQSELHDEYLASDAFWLWKEQSQGRWGLFDFADGAWTERPQVVAWVSRPHAERIAGDPESLAYDGATGELTLRAHRTGGAAHVLYVPEDAAETFSLECNGAPVAAERDPQSGLVAVPCEGELRLSRGS